MHVLVIGAAGMVGRKLVARLAADGLDGRPIDRLTLVDVVAPTVPAGFGGTVEARAADIADPAEAVRLAALRPEVIVHLAAIVSGEAEADFDKGYRINLDGTRALLEAIRAEGMREPWCPRLVFTSSLAVFGAPLPEVIDDEHFVTPLTSYGTQKAICELLINDYTRRGVLDGVAIRLPTICIRPGRPNRAASGFFSSILREPLVGEEAVLPVDEAVRHWFASPRAAVGFLIRAATMATEPLGHLRTLDMPGLSATVGEEIAALDRIAGPAAVRLIRREADPAIARIVEAWPKAFEATRARNLGFSAETSFDEIIRIHVEDELGGRIGGS